MEKENNINIFAILKLLRQHLKIIFVFLLLGAAISGALSYFVITPKYASRTEVIVSLPSSNNGNMNANDVSSTLQMLSTYKDLILSDTVINTVKARLSEETNVNLAAKDLRRTLSIEQSQNSQMFSIQSTAATPTEAKDIANITADVFKEKVAKIINVDKITILSRGVANSSPVSPNHKLFLAAGAALGLFISIIIALLSEMSDTTIKSEDYLSKELSLQLLGKISPFQEGDFKLAEQRKIVQKS